MRRRKIWLTVTAAFTLLIWTPCLALLTSLSAASLFHCRVDESAVHPCVIAGVNRGALFSQLMIGGGWLAVAASPLMIASGLFWLGWLILRFVRRNQRLGG